MDNDGQVILPHRKRCADWLTEHKEKIAGFCDAWWAPGKVIGWIIRHFGFVTLSFFVVGGVVGVLLMAGVVWTGFAPRFLASRIETPNPKAGSKPQNLEVASMVTQPEWLQPFRNRLEAEGAKQKENQVIGGSLICPLMSDLSNGSGGPELLIPGFSLELSADRDCVLNGYGFRQTSAGLFEPIPLSKQTEKPHSVILTIPHANSRDKLLLLLRVSWKPNAAPLRECSIRSSVR
jgi:hypothetical protein